MVSACGYWRWDTRGHWSSLSLGQGGAELCSQAATAASMTYDSCIYDSWPVENMRERPNRLAYRTCVACAPQNLTDGDQKVHRW